MDFFLKSSTFPHVDSNIQSSELNPSENNHNRISKPLMIGFGTHAWLVFWLNHRSEEFTWISSTFLILKHPSYYAEDLLKRSVTTYSIFYMRYVYKKDKRHFMKVTFQELKLLGHWNAFKQLQSIKTVLTSAGKSNFQDQGVTVTVQKYSYFKHFQHVLI